MRSAGPSLTTNELTREAIRLLTAHHFTVWRTNAGKARYNVRLAPPGTPDLIGYGPGGRFVGIEIKGDGDDMRESQKAWREKAANSGAFVAEVHDIADVLNAIERYRR